MRNRIIKPQILAAALILLAVNLAWVWRLDGIDTENAQRMNESHDRFMEASRELYLMNRGWEFTIRTNAQQLPENVQARKPDGTALQLGNITGSGPRLVVVMSDRHCSSCVDQLLFAVRNEIPEPDRGNILVLFSMNGPTNQQWRHREKILGGAVFLEIDDGSLNLPLDSLDIPYLFVAGPGPVADLAFTPYPSLVTQTHKYLSMIRNRYFN